MNRPDVINYAGLKFTVRYTPDPYKSWDSWGYVDFAKNQITIATKSEGKPIAEISIAQTLLHEVCHIVLEYAGMGGSTDMFEPTNEYLTSLMSSGFTQLYLQNPDLIEYLNETFYDETN
jgi:hypothetical protein